MEKVCCLCWVGLVVALGGCREWTTMPREPVALPTPPPPLDAAELEIAFIDLGPGADEGPQSIWREIDETVVPLEQRSLFLENGLRWGVVGPIVPPRLQRLFRETSAEAGEGASLEKQLDWGGDGRVATSRRVQLRDGRTATIVVAKPSAEPLVLLWKDGGAARGIELQEAECQFELRSRRLDGGHLAVSLVPRIAHGKPRSKLVGHEGTWMVQTERERLVLKQLALEATLSPGQILVVGAASPLRAVGASFFAPGHEQHRPRRLLVIRLANAPADPTFDSPRLAD